MVPLSGDSFEVDSVDMYEAEGKGKGGRRGSGEREGEERVEELSRMRSSIYSHSSFQSK